MSFKPSSDIVTRGWRSNQSGFALITVLMLLVMLTLLAISMYRGFGLQEKIAGNTREKERAFQGAQNTLQFGETLLMSGAPATGIPCSGNSTVTSKADMRVCNAPLTNPGDPDNWVAASIYQPPSMTVVAPGGPIGGLIDDPTTGQQDIKYLKLPKLNMSYMGRSDDAKQALFLVTAAGYGGTDGTRAVVQSVYSISSSITALDQP